MFVFTCVRMYKEKGAFGLKIVIALMLKLCVDIIVCFSCFLLLTLFHKHALINQRRCTPAEGREVHQIGSQFGVKNGVLKLLTCWDINKSKVFVCKPWRLILYNSMSCLCFYDWCFWMFQAWCKSSSRPGLALWLVEVRKH